MAAVTVQSNVDGSWTTLNDWDGNTDTLRLSCGDEGETTVTSQYPSDVTSRNWTSKFLSNTESSEARAVYTMDVDTDTVIIGTPAVHVKAAPMQHLAQQTAAVSDAIDRAAAPRGIDHEEKEFIQNVFEFDDLTAEEIATHRTDVDLLWLDDTMDDWAETIHNTRHTRYPVCEDSADNVVGILNAKEYFRLADKSRESVMAGAVRAPYFVPETIKADALFRNMKRTGNPLAVVLDEYGGMVGIVTLNDLVEELVGDLGSDDSNIPDDDEPRIEKLPDGSLSVTGNVELDDLEDALDIELDQEEHDTLTGLVFDALGMIPDDGEQDITLEAEGMRIHVTSIADHQVNAAQVWLLPKEATPEDEE